MKKDPKGLNILIGTGFIGSNLTQDFDLKIDSRVRMAYGTPANTITIAAPSGSKNSVNENAESDSKDIISCMSLLNTVKSFTGTKKIYLISTIDALCKTNTPYGKNRAFLVKSLKDYCKENNIELYVFYLGATYGKNEYEGLVYDFQHNDARHYSFGSYQLYNVKWLEDDMKKCEEQDIHEAVLASEPIKVKEIAKTMAVSLDFAPKVGGDKYKVKALGVPLIKKERILESLSFDISYSTCIGELKHFKESNFCEKGCALIYEIKYRAKNVIQNLKNLVKKISNIIK